MTDTRAMPWSEARLVEAAIREVETWLDTLPGQPGPSRLRALRDAVLALGDRCAQAEQRIASCDCCEHEFDGSDRKWNVVCERCWNGKDSLQRLAQADVEIARMREELKDCEKRQAADRKSALDNYAKWEQAEARGQELEETLTRTGTAYADEHAKVMALEAQIAALTKERDALRVELLEQDDAREGV